MAALKLHSIVAFIECSKHVHGQGVWWSTLPHFNLGAQLCGEGWEQLELFLLPNHRMGWANDVVIVRTPLRALENTHSSAWSASKLHPYQGIIKSLYVLEVTVRWATAHGVEEGTEYGTSRESQTKRGIWQPQTAHVYTSLHVTLAYLLTHTFPYFWGWSQRESMISWVHRPTSFTLSSVHIICLSLHPSPRLPPPTHVRHPKLSSSFPLVKGLRRANCRSLKIYNLLPHMDFVGRYELWWFLALLFWRACIFCVFLSICIYLPLMLLLLLFWIVVWLAWCTLSRTYLQVRVRYNNGWYGIEQPLHELEWHSGERVSLLGWTVYVLYPTDRPDLLTWTKI